MTLPPTTPRAAMILAAGRGTRMGALTEDCPKPMLMVAGKRLIDHAFARAAEGGAVKVVVNLHYLGGQIRTHLAGLTWPEILYSDEAELLETGGGLVRARPLLGDAPFYAINSDAIWTGDAPLPKLAQAWDPARMDVLMLMVPIRDALAYTRRGDFFLDDDMRPSRRGDAPFAPYVFTGAQIMAPAALDGFTDRPFSANEIWDRALAAGRLFGVVHHGGWVDVGTPEGLVTAAAALHRGAEPRP